MQWLEVSRQALRHNISLAKAALPHQKCWPCVKANAYGHGLSQVIAAIDDLVDGYCVVSTTEALELRRLTNHFIFVLNNVDRDEIRECLSQDIVLPLASQQQAQWYAQLAQPVRVHLEIDTGMARTGFKWREPEEMLAFIQSLPANIVLEGLWSHYAAAGEDDAYTRKQYDDFSRFVEAFRSRVFEDIIVHLDKSGSVFLDQYHWPDNWRGAFRIGVATYGYDPRWPTESKLLTALSWKSQVISVRTIERNEPVGYGLSFVPEKRTTIASIPVGYADGYPRAISNVGSVLIRGLRCPIRGRICMNVLMVEVPDSVQEGEEVVLLGAQGGDEITAYDLAQWSATTHYEIIARLSPTLPRELLD